MRGTYIEVRGHGPVVYIHAGAPQAMCHSCDWVGPVRVGDGAVLIAEDDACWHLHRATGYCGQCVACADWKLTEEGTSWL